MTTLTKPEQTQLLAPAAGATLMVIGPFLNWRNGSRGLSTDAAGLLGIFTLIFGIAIVALSILQLLVPRLHLPRQMMGLRLDKFVVALALAPALWTFGLIWAQAPNAGLFLTSLGATAATVGSLIAVERTAETPATPEANARTRRRQIAMGVGGLLILLSTFAADWFGVSGLFGVNAFDRDRLGLTGALLVVLSVLIIVASLIRSAGRGALVMGFTMNEVALTAGFAAFIWGFSVTLQVESQAASLLCYLGGIIAVIASKRLQPADSAEPELDADANLAPADAS